LKRPETAVADYRKALAQAPNDPDTLDNLALGLKDLDRPDEAIHRKISPARSGHREQ
jgi:hypothetical protein